MIEKQSAPLHEGKEKGVQGKCSKDIESPDNALFPLNGTRRRPKESRDNQKGADPIPGGVGKTESCSKKGDHEKDRHDRRGVDDGKGKSGRSRFKSLSHHSHKGC